MYKVFYQAFLYFSNQRKPNEDKGLFFNLLNLIIEFIPLLNPSRLFQRRSSLRVKKIVDPQKETRHQDEDDLVLISEDESDNKLSYTEKYLEQRNKQLSQERKISEDLQNKRAFRAQRRLEAKPYKF